MRSDRGQSDRVTESDRGQVRVTLASEIIDIIEVRGKMDSEHSGNTMSPFLAIVGIRNHKLLLLLVGKRSYCNALAVGISLDGPDVNKIRHRRLVHRFVFLRQVFLQ